MFILKIIRGFSIPTLWQRQLSNHLTQHKLSIRFNKPNRLTKHISEAFRLGRFSCVPTEANIDLCQIVYCYPSLFTNVWGATWKVLERAG